MFIDTLERKGGGGSSSSPAMIVNRSMLALAEQLREDARLANEQLANNEIGKNQAQSQGCGHLATMLCFAILIKA